MSMMMAEAEMLSSPFQAFVIAEYEATETHIGPLLTTIWDQFEPFNRLTPHNYPAGCVATATAQVMNYHRCPNTFNWDLMRDDYKSISTYLPVTEAQRNEVAKLMPVAGVSVRMDYGNNGSDAMTSDVPNALKITAFSCILTGVGADLTTDGSIRIISASLMTKENIGTINTEEEWS